MNERIKELSLAASDTIPDNTSVEHALYLFQKNFAELLIRKCAEVAADCGAYKPEYAIKQHFGVEE